jgi:alkanesulfonate monooxygenase
MEAHMPVEFIGWIDTQESSEISLRPGPLVDAGYLRDIAGAHEEADFDRVLIGWFSSRPDGLQVAAQAAATTDRLGMLIAHRPGFIAPTLAARMFATLDQFTGGRVALHTISGSSDVEQRRDGDYLTKDQRYARTDEYLDIVRMTWTRDEPFSYDGEYYKLEDGFSSVKPTQEPHIPIFFGGSSEAAYRVGPTCSCSGVSRSPRRPSRSRRSGPTPTPSAPARSFPSPSARSWPRPTSWPGRGPTTSSPRSRPAAVVPSCRR